MHGPQCESRHPIHGHPRVVFLKHFIKTSNIHVGDYTYYDNWNNDPTKFEEHSVLYNNHPSRVKLVIGKFCALAAETKFLMTGDHKLDGISTYPFPIFGQGWEHAFDMESGFAIKGDIIVGHDVWFGYDSLVKNGVTIGNGAIIAARAVVVKDVPAYSIVAGNPAKVVKMRFDEPTIERLQKIAWWDWNIEKITRHAKLICHLDVDRLEQAGEEKY